MTFDMCPICGEELQCTQVNEVYYSGSTFRLDWSGPRGDTAEITLKDKGFWNSENEETEDLDRLYCANDHSTTEMAAYFAAHPEALPPDDVSPATREG
jgi:hypothetical protein